MNVRRRHGRVRLHLEPAEADLLGVLFDQLEVVLDGAAGADDPVLQRLNPAAYPDDPEADADFRALTEGSLRSERSDRMAACRADLAAGGGDVDLGDPEAMRRWLQVLNDLRLALGTRLGITEDDDHEVDPDDPAGEPRSIYYWLTAVQDSVVRSAR